MAAEPCPAADPLCVCEVRGCPLYDQHMRAFVVIPRRRWHRGGSKKPRHGRR